jgi:parallel beta-helix repeat protein
VTSLIALPSFIITITPQTVSAQSSENFTIVALPDTQYYAASYPTIFDNQTNWIVKNQTAQNIVFVSHLGDIVDTASNTTQWQRADASMRILDNKVLYGILPGNHDLQDGGTNYESYFPPSRYSYWNGSYVSYSPSNNLNNYQLFSTGGMNFIAIDLEYDPPADVLTWAGNVLDNYSDRRAIISTHSYLTFSGALSTTGGQNIYNNLVVPHNNVFLVLCGHSYDSTTGYGVWERTDTFGGGRVVYQLLSDYQDVALGDNGKTGRCGDGWLRIMKFVPSENKIYVKTYSPYEENYWIDSANQFEMYYPMGATVAGGVKVSILPPSQDNLPGGTLTYTVTVINLDNVQENYILTRGDNAGWGLGNLVLDNYWLLVPKGESRTTKLNVTIPSNATGDTWDNIWVKATSKDNDNEWDNESCLAHVVGTWAQNSWSGGPTTPSLDVGAWSSSYNNFYKGENVDWSACVRLSLPSTAGWFESSIFDAGSIADWGVVNWGTSMPLSGSSDTYVSSHSEVKGTVTEFALQQSADDEGATLAEESLTYQTDNNRGLYQDIPATAGISYTETGWVYSPAGIGSSGMGIVFTFYDSSNHALSPSSPNGYNSIKNIWQENTATATAPTGTAFARVRVRAYADGANPAGYADNLKFYVTSAPGTNLLSNPSLESWTGGVPDNWHAEYDTGFRILQENVTVEDGSYSARMDTKIYTYDMEIYENIAGVPSADNQTLKLRYELANENDTFNVQVWNGSAWNTRGYTLSSTSWDNWSYQLLSSEIIGGKVQVRFVDSNPSSNYQDNILIDYLRVESYSAPWSGSLVVKLRTNTTAGDTNPYDGGWSDWYLQDNIAENTLMGNGRYIQYRVELSTTDNTKTIELLKIKLNYEVFIRGPILIIGDGGFTPENGVNGGGTGTESDPYIIENWMISASSANGIEIRNTTDYFVVRNCVVKNGWIAASGVNYYGIELYNVVNGRIDNNTCVNDDYGIVLYANSDNNALINNTCANNFWYGIRLENSSNNTITNNTCANTKYYSIGLDHSDNNILDNNTCESNGGGIYLYDSENIKMRNNTLSNNLHNFGMEGTTLSHFVHDIDNSNLVNGKPILYLIGHSNEVIGPSPEMGYLGLVNCDNILVENLVLKHNIQGILIASTQDSQLENCKFENNGFGIYLWGSDNNILTTNNCENGGRGIQLLTSNNNTLANNICEDDNYFGIRLDDSDNNIIKNSTFSSDSENGVRLYSSDNNIIENNTISNDNQGGIWFEYDSVNNTIRNNNITSNNRYGIYILNSNDNNRIYHNNFENNANQVYDNGSNYWDNGYPYGGNYWSDYAGVDENHGENQNIAGSDGIGDTPYNIPGDNNRDRYPLMNPVLPTWVNTGNLENAWHVYSLLYASGAVYAGTASGDDNENSVGVVFKTTDGGTTWVPTASLGGLGVVGNIEAMIQTRGGTIDNNIFIGTAWNGKIFKTTNGGDNWIEVISLPGVWEVDSLIQAANGNLYAGTHNGGTNKATIYRSTNYGDDWEVVAELSGCTTVECLIQASTGYLYCGTQPGNVWRSDNGDNWYKVGDKDINFGGSYKIYSLLDASNHYIYAASRNPGNVYRSTDNGNTWAEVANENTELGGATRTDALRQASNGIIYVGTDVGKIYRSTDGDNWVLEANLPADRVNAIIEGPDYYLYAGTSYNGDVFKTQISTVESFNLHLVAGWNLVGFPLVSDTTTPTNMFGSNLKTMKYWTAPSGPYKDAPYSAPVQDNLGYWVQLKDNQDVILSGALWANRTLYLVAGWNLVHFPLTSASTTPTNLFGSNLKTMKYWTAPGGPYRDANYSAPVVPGLGYWVQLKENQNITIPL